jgi:hypothetical protein
MTPDPFIATAARPVDFMIAGAQKSGTTALARLLARRADITFQREIEFPYFVDDWTYRRGYEAAFNKAYGSGTDRERVLAKSAGVMFLPHALDRLRDHNADCHVIVTLREPVSRAYSAFWYQRKVGLEPLPTFEQALDAEERRLEEDFERFNGLAYFHRGDYASQLREIHRRFSKDRIHLVIFEELVASPSSTMLALVERLGLDGRMTTDTTLEPENCAATSRSPVISRLLRRPGPLARSVAQVLPQPLLRSVRTAALQWNEREGRPDPMHPETADGLRARYAPSMTELEELLGRSLDVWRGEVPSL